MADYQHMGNNASRLTPKIILGTVIAMIVLVVGLVAHNIQQVAAIDTFEKCAAKYPVMTSYPEQCRTPDGRIFTGPTKR
jgi:hypothetical protein